MSEGGSCLRCGTEFATYFCQDCGIANSDVPNEGYFHCTACGICRVGSRQEFFHCQGCGCCLRRHLMGNHTCHPAALDAPCPICLEGLMFDSQTPADLLPCGHMWAHKQCIDRSSARLSSICRACNSAAGVTGSRIACLPYRSSEQAAPRVAAAEASSSGSRSSSTAAGSSRPLCVDSSSAYESDLMDLLAEAGCVDPTELADVRGLVRELMEQELLPQRRVEFDLSDSYLVQYGKRKARPHDGVMMQKEPRLFRQLLEAAIKESILHTAPEIIATGKATDAVVQLLQGSTAGALQLAGQRVTIDRFAVAGSVGKAVGVQGLFDVDLVAFVNLPTSAGAVVDLDDPDKTQGSWWMRDLMEQLLLTLSRYLSAELPHETGWQFADQPSVGRTAVTFAVLVPVKETGEGVELEFDILLAPNMAAGAEASAASAAGFPPASIGLPPSEIQCRAVLYPVLALADRVASHTCGTSSSASSSVKPVYARNIWLTEAATTFVKQAAVAAAAGKGGLSGRVVTSTIRLVKAWVRKGLQPSTPGFKALKGFMIELMVLHAAEHFVANRKQQQQQIGSGIYVLDLLLEVLEVAMSWAADATSSPPSSSSPIMFTALARRQYYSRQQALALQAMAQVGLWPDVQGLVSSRPMVIHPVDPLCSVFNQAGGYSFKCWRELGEAASLLSWQLQHCTWREIMQSSTLGDALRFDE